MRCSGVSSNPPNNICKCMYIRGVKSKYTERQHGGQSPPNYLSHLHKSLKLKQCLDMVQKCLKWWPTRRFHLASGLIWQFKMCKGFIVMDSKNQCNVDLCIWSQEVTPSAHMRLVILYISHLTCLHLHSSSLSMLSSSSTLTDRNRQLHDKIPLI